MRKLGEMVGMDRWIRLSSAMGLRDYPGQAEHKELDEALAYLRPEDTLVVMHFQNLHPLLAKTTVTSETFETFETSETNGSG